MAMIKEIKKKLESQKKASTQKVLAKKLGKSEGYISLLLSGKRPIPKHLETKFRKYTNDAI